MKKEEMIAWDNFSQEEKIFVDLMIFSYEVGNGGLEQYYWNSTGNSAFLIPEYLKIVGSKTLTKMMEEINRFFGETGPNENRKKRQEQLRQLTQMQKKIMNDSSELFCDGPEDIEKFLIDFVIKHKLDKIVKNEQ
ncbi:MAG: DUF4375 domain-containing protein [Candidatus Lokiarchaeota archaeon]|nr:DUF4375 domain-containing protein [Candidatus Lokiarchaeota archaeon]